MSRWSSVVRGRAVPSVLFAALLIVALVFLDELRGWFSLSGRSTVERSRSAPVAAAPESHFTFPDAARAAIDGSLVDYERARATLARDQLEGLDRHGEAMANQMRRATAAVTESPSGEVPRDVVRTLGAAGAAAEVLASAGDLAGARRAFGELSRAILRLARFDPRLREGRHVFSCPMAEGFERWMQPNDALENPYMGQKMIGCGESSTFPDVTDTHAISHDGHGHAGNDVAFYTCAMHPSVKQDGPGTCPICAMDLTPVTYDEEEGGVLLVDALRRQRIGVRTSPVEISHMVKRVRTAGRLTYDETALHDVSLKYRGWIQRLHADKVGMRVKRGEPLFSVYSPEVYAAQGDLITAMRGPTVLREREGVPERGGDPLVAMARERLHLMDVWGLDKHLADSGQPVRWITVTSPARGYVLEKNVVEGSAFAAGDRVMRIAGLDTVWIEAEIYEADLPLVREGQLARVTLTHLPDVRYEGELTYLYPYLDPRTRTGKARIELENTDLALKPDMYANVIIEVDLGERLSIPESAVIYTGPRRLVFVDMGEGRLRPREVTLGVHAGDRYEVVRGLSANDVVVTSGNFLIAAESRIRSAALYWGGAEHSPEEPVPLEPRPLPPPTEANTSPPSRGAQRPNPSPPAPAAATPATPADQDVYTCPMHPEVMSPVPGSCPKCGMALVEKARR